MTKPLLMSLLAAAAVSHAATVIIPVTADTSMHEISPDSNMGAMTHFAAGAIRQEATEGGFPRARGLLRFDLAGKIPAGATITSASLRVRVTFKPIGGPASIFEAHRL